jgi:hypothetical protein
LLWCQFSNFLLVLMSVHVHLNKPLSITSAWQMIGWGTIIRLYDCLPAFA